MKNKKIIKFLQKLAFSLTEKRREKYDIKISPETKRVITSDLENVNFSDILKLIFIILRIYPIKFFKNTFKYLADLDTKKRLKRIEEIKNALKIRLSSEANLLSLYFERRLYSFDIGEIPPFIEKFLYKTTPFLVVQPKDENDIVEVFRFARIKKIPVFPRGIGSSGVGGSIPTNNGIVIDISPMDKILSIDLKNMTITVQAGAKWGDIENELSKNSFTLKTFPTSRYSTVGGWICTGGFGLNGFKYGHISNYIKGFKVVHPTGEIVNIKQEDEIFPLYFHTEGQLGIITEVVLEFTKKSLFSKPYLLYFNESNQAFDFIKKLIEKGIKPTHIKFIDRHHIIDQNLIFKKSFNKKEEFFENKDALLLHFDDENEDKRFAHLITECGKDKICKLEKELGAFFLWEERFLPMKIKKLGPSLLASELIMSLENTPLFLNKVKELGKRFRAVILFDVQIIKTEESYKTIVLAMFTCDQRKIFYYLIYLILVEIITKVGIKLNGKPYGIGIWNAAFLKDKFTKESLKKIKKYKQVVDPWNILNPMKFISIGSRFLNIPSIIFNRYLFNVMIDFFIFISPIVEPLAKVKDFILGSKLFKFESKKDKVLEESIFQCTNCGSCAAVCPAYLVTKSEAVIARSKLRLAKEVLNNKKRLKKEEIIKGFFCLKCGMCQNVCQSNLSLVDCWESLEKILVDEFFLPKEEIKNFIEEVDKNCNYLLRTNDYQELNKRWK